MDPIRSLHPLARTWLLDGPLSADLDAYLALLERGRYAEGSIEKHLRTLAHFSHWMTRCRLSAAQLDEDFVDQFLNHHLPRCDCHATALRTRGDLSAGLGHLLVVLRLQRVIAERPSPTGPVAEELCRYDAHMRDARGLAASTREGRLSIVGQLLLWKFSGRAFAVGELQAEDLRSFIAQELTRVNTVSHATALASALRAYLRYRSTCGDVVHALLGVIASPARWALATLPRALTPQEVERLMTHCEQTRTAPRRLLAMVRLALDLGLRGGEIARLELCDIDWRAVRTTPLTPFFVGSRGLRRGGPLGDRQVHRMFGQLRQQLGWVDRGGHGQPRVHDLRHSFAVRRLILWHEQGVDLDQRMLALSTYLGHVKISNT